MLSNLKILTALSLVLSCSSLNYGGREEANAANLARPPVSSSPRDGDTISQCIAQISRSTLPLREVGDRQSYSHAGDFDGNGKEDVAVLVESDQAPIKSGLLICRNGDVKQTSGFGPVFKSAKRLTSFDEDNFITSEWEVILKTESSKIALGPDGKSRIRNRNKGDVISFFHEGGAVFIFWDGTQFLVVEGG